MSDYQITAIAADGPAAVLEVVVGGVVHRLLVTPAGACLVPCALALHPLREAIEAECQQVAAQARLGWVA